MWHNANANRFFNLRRCCCCWQLTTTTVHRAHILCAIGDHKWHWPRTHWIKLNSCRVRRWERHCECGIKWMAKYVIRWWKIHFNRFAVDNTMPSIEHKYLHDRCDHISWRCRALNGHFDSHKCAEITRNEIKNKTKNETKHSLCPISATYLMRMTQWHDVDDIVAYDRTQ